MVDAVSMVGCDPADHRWWMMRRTWPRFIGIVFAVALTAAPGCTNDEPVTCDNRSEYLHDFLFIDAAFIDTAAAKVGIERIHDAVGRDPEAKRRREAAVLSDASNATYRAEEARRIDYTQLVAYLSRLDNDNGNSNLLVTKALHVVEDGGLTGLLRWARAGSDSDSPPGRAGLARAVRADNDDIPNPDVPPQEKTRLKDPSC